MGSDDLFKKRREARQKRRHEFKDGESPAKFAPGTTVHILVEKLRVYLR